MMPKSQQFSILLVSICLLLVYAAIAGDPGAGGEYEPRTILIGVTAEAFHLPEGSVSAPFDVCHVSEEIWGVLAPFGPEVVSRVFPSFIPERYIEYDYIPPLDIFHRIMFTSDIDVHAVSETLDRVHGVFSAEPNYYLLLDDLGTEESAGPPSRRETGKEKMLSVPPDDTVFWGAPSDSGFGDQWNLHDDHCGIGCEEAWTYTTGSSTVRVGVVEDGIWNNHTDMDVEGGFQVWYNAVFNCYETAALDTNCFRVHSTRVAGIIGATTNNGFGVAGVAGGDGVTSGCSLFEIQMAQGTLTASGWAFAIEEAVDPLGAYHCDVLSFSTATQQGSETLRAAVLFAYSVGANIVASKGNDTTPPLRYPAGYDDHWLTAVAAYDSSGVPIYDSNTGCTLDIIAPGQFCPTLAIQGSADPTSTVYMAQLLSLFGASSCATPHVAGSIGLLRSFLGNNLPAEDYASILALSAIDTVDSDQYTWNEDIGHGRLHIGDALENANNHKIYAFETSSTSVVDSATVTVEFATGPYTSPTSAIRYKVQGTLEFDPVFTAQPLVWGSGDPPYTFGFHGYSASLKNYREPFHEVEPASIAADSCNVFTYTYKMWNDDENDYVDWYPACPSQIPVAARALGTRMSSKSADEVPPRQGALSLYPNPFNATVSVCYDVSWPGVVSIDVLDVRGVRVRRLHSGWTTVGELVLTWNGTDQDGRLIASGVYLVKVTTERSTTVTKLTLAK